MNIKSKYFKMNKDEFNKYITDLKASENTISFFDGKFFYYNTLELSNLLVMLNNKAMELEYLINSFTYFTKKQIIQSFLISEIEATNKIENISSTKHDIYNVLQKVSNSNDKKIISICNCYKSLFDCEIEKIASNEDIRTIYDKLLFNCISEDSLPDGKYFRTKPVFITDGISVIHTGMNEKLIEDSIEEIIGLYNSNENIFLKMILFHFLFEYIHPFYDGNGRIGRYLFSNGLLSNGYEIVSYLISSSILNDKSKYYKAFKLATDRYQFGCVNDFVKSFIEILDCYITKITEEIKTNKEAVNKMLDRKMSKSEMKIFKLLCEASIYTSIGVSNEEILYETKVSKRTLIYTLNKLRCEDLIEEVKIGKYKFYKIVI